MTRTFRGCVRGLVGGLWKRGDSGSLRKSVDPPGSMRPSQSRARELRPSCGAGQAPPPRDAPGPCGRGVRRGLHVRGEATVRTANCGVSCVRVHEFARRSSEVCSRPESRLLPQHLRSSGIVRRLTVVQFANYIIALTYF